MARRPHCARSSLTNASNRQSVARDGIRHVNNPEISVYDAQNNQLIRIPSAQINSYIDALPLERRHWVQLIASQVWIKNIVLYLMPRLDYLFHT